MAVRVSSGTLQTVNEHNHTEYLVFEYLSLKRTKVMHIFLKMIELIISKEFCIIHRPLKILSLFFHVGSKI